MSKKPIKMLIWIFYKGIKVIFQKNFWKFAHDQKCLLSWRWVCPEFSTQHWFDRQILCLCQTKWCKTTQVFKESLTFEHFGNILPTFCWHWQLRKLVNIQGQLEVLDWFIFKWLYTIIAYSLKSSSIFNRSHCIS